MKIRKNKHLEINNYYIIIQFLDFIKIDIKLQNLDWHYIFW